MQMPVSNTIFKVIFHNQGEVYEIFALEVYPSDMINFVTVEQLKFNNKNSQIIDPSEEKLKSEFESVERTYIPVHSVIRIDEVTELGVAKITLTDHKVTPFPSADSTTSLDNET